MQSFSFLRVVRRPFFSCLAAAAVLASAGGAASQPVGVFPIPLHGSADTRVSIPLERPFLAVAPVLSVSGAVLTLPPGVTSLLEAAPEGAYHFVSVRSGALAGCEIPILALAGDTVTLGPRDEDLAQLHSGDRLAIVPYWTPETLFAHHTPADRTAIFVYDTDRVGVNKAPDEVFTYFAGYGWYTGDFEGAGSYPLRRGDAIVIRTPRGTESSLLDVVGNVPLTPHRRVFPGQDAGRASDIHFGLSVPVGVSLEEAQLEFLDRTSLFVYEGASRYNPAPREIYTFFAGYGWYDGQLRPVDPSSFQLRPGVGYVLRVPPSTEAVWWESKVWPAYLGI